MQGLSRVCVYIDDIITGQTEAEHTKNIEAVLQRLHSVDMRLKKEKCSWPKVEYLSHKISKHGIEPTMEKVRAITEAPHPKNVRAFLGLSSTEQRYSQLDKEALAIVAGVKKFHQYLAGRRFEINTDHKPLIYIFDQHRGISPLASGRIQRWSLILAGYDYTVRHRPGKEIPNADALSRLPLSETISVTLIPAELIHLVEHLNSTPSYGIRN